MKMFNFQFSMKFQKNLEYLFLVYKLLDQQKLGKALLRRKTLFRVNQTLM